MDDDSNDSDRAWILRARAGDMEALGLLYDRHAPAVYSFLCSMLDTHTAEDILQDTFVAAFDRLGAYIEQGAFRSWLFSMARTRALDRLRRVKRFREKQEAHLLNAPHKAEPTPTEVSASDEITSRIMDAVRTLPPMQQSVFLLRHQGGFSFQEISEQLQLPQNTTLSHMHRALATLRKLLGNLIEES